MKRKYKLHSNKFAYLQIDFAFSILIFFMLFIFIYYVNNDYKEMQNQEYIINLLQKDARDVCFLLTTQSGNPSNWEDDFLYANILGLKSDTYNILDTSKMNIFTNNNYFYLIDILGIDNYLNVKIIGTQTNTTYLDFGTSNDFGTYYANYMCYSNYNSEIVKVIVEAWK